MQYFLNVNYGLLNLFDNHIFVFSPTGKLIAEAPYSPDRRRLDYSKYDYIRKTTQTELPYISAPYPSMHTPPHPLIMLTAPVFNNHGELIAILAGSIALTNNNFLTNRLKTKLGETGYMYIFNTDRTIIMHPDASKIIHKDLPIRVAPSIDNVIAGFV